jgi:hypothetical protein
MRPTDIVAKSGVWWPPALLLAPAAFAVSTPGTLWVLAPALLIIAWLVTRRLRRISSFESICLIAGACLWIVALVVGPLSQTAALIVAVAALGACLGCVLAGVMRGR